MQANNNNLKRSLNKQQRTGLQRKQSVTFPDKLIMENMPNRYAEKHNPKAMLEKLIGFFYKC